MVKKDHHSNFKYLISFFLITYYFTRKLTDVEILPSEECDLTLLLYSRH